MQGALLYPGRKDLTVLKFVVNLFKIKVNHGWSDESFTQLLQLIRNVLPLGNKAPTNTDQARKIIKSFGLDRKIIHACPNDCILYWKEHEFKTSCPTCGVFRYKNPDLERSSTCVPAKVLRYFPLTPRLQRMYIVPWLSKQMSWHSTGKISLRKMRHSVDSATWKNIDTIYKDFSDEPLNVRLGLATDWFNPCKSFSSSYSCWPIVSMVYNLSPFLCKKPQFTMLTLLIEGPQEPGKDIDVYLQPLVAELKEMWEKGVMTSDAYNDNKFNMHAVLLWTTHDIPASLMQGDYVLKDKPCKLVSDQARSEVACGLLQSIDPSSIVHGKTMGEGNFKISLTNVVVPNCQLFMPDGCHQTLGKVALGSCVVWP